MVRKRGNDDIMEEDGVEDFLIKFFAALLQLRWIPWRSISVVKQMAGDHQMEWLWCLLMR